MREAHLWLFVATSTLLIVHEIDSAFFKEWELLHLPFGHQGFVLVHAPLAAAILAGVVGLSRASAWAWPVSGVVAAAGIFAFTLHTVLIRKGHPEFTVPASRLILGLLLLCSLAQAGALVASMTARRTPDGWPLAITFNRLGVSEKELERQQEHGRREPEHNLWAAPGELRHVYGGHGPTGHGMTTAVYYVPDAGVFYLYSNCGQNHGDSVLGPFAGDPREILAN